MNSLKCIEIENEKILKLWLERECVLQMSQLCRSYESTSSKLGLWSMWRRWNKPLSCFILFVTFLSENAKVSGIRIKDSKESFNNGSISKKHIFNWFLLLRGKEISGNIIQIPSLKNNILPNQLRGGAIAPLSIGWVKYKIPTIFSCWIMNLREIFIHTYIGQCHLQKFHINGVVFWSDYESVGYFWHFCFFTFFT